MSQHLKTTKLQLAIQVNYIQQGVVCKGLLGVVCKGLLNIN